MYYPYDGQPQRNVCPGCGYCRHCGQYRGLPNHNHYFHPSWSYTTGGTAGNTTVPVGQPGGEDNAER